MVGTATKRCERAIDDDELPVAAAGLATRELHSLLRRFQLST